MERNWLIRTRRNQILGPVTKDKIVELLKKKALLEDDEICSGNGFWFFVREQILLDKFIVNDVSQKFNHITEALNVLTDLDNDKDKIDPNYNEVLQHTVIRNINDYDLSENNDDQIESDKIPNDYDLELPGIIASAKEANPGTDKIVLPRSVDLELPDITQIKKDIENNPVEIKAFNVSLATDKQDKIEASVSDLKIKLDSIPEGDEPMVLPDNQELEYPSITRLTGQTLEPTNIREQKKKIINKEKVVKSDMDSHETNEFKEFSWKAASVTNSVEDSQDLSRHSGVIEIDMSKVEGNIPTDEPVELDEESEEERKERHRRKNRFKERLHANMEPTVDIPVKNIKKIERKVYSDDLSEKQIKVVLKDKAGNENLLLYALFFIFILIGAMLYYYTEILKKPLPIISMDSLNIIDYAYAAQTSSVNLKNKTRIYNRKQNNSIQSLVSLEHDIDGTILVSNDYNIPINCNFKNRYDFLLTLMTVNKNIEDYKLYTKRCSMIFSEQEKQITDWIFANKLSSINLDHKLVAIKKIKKKRISGRFNLENILNKVSRLKIRHQIKIKNIQEVNDIFIDLKEVPSTFIDQLISSYLYLSIENKVKAIDCLVNVVRMDKWQILFELDLLLFTEKSQKQFIEVINHISSLLKSEPVLKLVVENISFLKIVNDKKNVVNSFMSSQNKNIKTLNNKYYGRYFPWLRIKYDMKLNSLQVDWLRTFYHNKNNIKNLDFKEIKFLLVQQNTYLKQVGLDYMFYIKKKHHKLFRYYLIELNKFDSLKGFLKLKFKQYDFYSINFQREFFKANIENGHMISLSLKRLYELGDININYLWWYLL